MKTLNWEIWLFISSICLLPPFPFLVVYRPAEATATTATFSGAGASLSEGALLSKPPHNRSDPAHSQPDAWGRPGEPRSYRNSVCRRAWLRRLVGVMFASNGAQRNKTNANQCSVSNVHWGRRSIGQFDKNRPRRSYDNPTELLSNLNT